MMRALIRRLRTEQSGLSLTELLVASMLTLLILAMVGNLFISVTRITTTSNEIRMSNDSATNIVNEVTSAIRVSTDLATSTGSTDPAVLNGSGRDVLEIYALANTKATAVKPSKIKFELLNDPAKGGWYVKETSCPATASGATWVFTTTCTSRILGAGVASPSSNPLFTYRDSAGTAMTIVGSGLSATQRDTVASITVSVKAQVTGTTPSNANPTLVTNTVVLRNLGLDTAS